VARRPQKGNLSDLSFLNEIPDPIPPEANERAGDRRLRGPQGGVPTRNVTERRRGAALGVSLAWLCTHLVVYGVRQDFAQLPAGYIAAQVVLPIVFATCCLIVALAPGKLGLGVGLGLVSTMAWLGPASYWALALGMPMPHPAEPSTLGFWLGSLLCLDITLAWAAAPLLLVSLSLRRAFAGRAGGRSALVGAALGLLSGAAINLHCPNVDPWHLLAGHGVPVAVAALLGAFLVVRWTRA
jgi:Negative regulator of sigma F